jgi:hypothetical protein
MIKIPTRTRLGLRRASELPAQMSLLGSWRATYQFVSLMDV